MGTVSDRIIADAGDRALEIEKECSERAEELSREYDLMISDILEEQEEMLRKVYKQEFSRLSAEHAIGLNMKILSVKREILEGIPDAVRSGIVGDQELYRKYIISCAVRGVESGREEIIIAEEDVPVFSPQFIDELNSKLSEKFGRNVELKLSEERRDTGGGFYLRENRREFNATIDSAVGVILSEFETEAAAMLFKGE